MVNISKNWNEKFPKNKHNLCNGSALKASEDMPFFGLSAGQAIPIHFDGEYVRCGTLSWSVEQLSGEIDAGVWDVVSDEEMKQIIETVANRSSNILKT